MRVLHIFKIYFPDAYGGIEQAIHSLASRSMAQGIESRVLTLSPRGKIFDADTSGYSIHRYPRNLDVASTGMSLQFLMRFRREAAWADLLHFHFPWPFGDLAYLMSGIETPAVMTYHSDIVKQAQLLRLYRPLRDRHLGRMARIVATSPNYVASSEVLQQWRDKVEVVPCGIATVKPRDQEAIWRWRQQIGERFFVFLGVPRYYKGLDFLLEALVGRDYPLALIGDGAERAALEGRVRALGLKNVHFLGLLNDEEKADVLAAASGFVFPSHVRTEAFGLALAEAAQQGLPMISCEIGTGTSFVNLHQETGLVVPPRDSHALGEAMDCFWNDPEQAKLWGRNARARYLELFTEDAMVRGYVRCYRDVLGQSPAP